MILDRAFILQTPVLLQAYGYGFACHKIVFFCFCFWDSEESFGPDGISLRGALEAGGP